MFLPTMSTKRDKGSGEMPTLVGGKPVREGITFHVRFEKYEIDAAESARARLGAQGFLCGWQVGTGVKHEHRR